MGAGSRQCSMPARDPRTRADAPDGMHAASAALLFEMKRCRNCKCERLRDRSSVDAATGTPVKEPLQTLSVRRETDGAFRTDLTLAERRSHHLLERRGMRVIASERGRKTRRVVREHLRVVTAPRERHVAESAVDELFTERGVDVDEHAIGGLPLAAVAGDGISVIQVRLCGGR